MGTRVLFISALCSLFFLFSFTGGSDNTLKSGGGPPYNTNAPGDQTCSGVEGTNSCHSGGIPDNSGPATTGITFSGGSSYVPGQTYTITLNVSHPSRNRFGFQIVSVLNSTLTNAGTVILTDTNRTRAQIPTWGSYQDRNYVMHVLNGTYGTSNANQWSYNWKAPAGNVGKITFYACFLAANNNNTNDPGDETYYKSLVIDPAPAGLGVSTDAKAEIKMFPNPAVDQIHISTELARSSEFSADLYDLQGRFVKRLYQSCQRMGMITETLPLPAGIKRGIYFVRFSAGQETSLQKLFIE
jgi:hypothetical protein